MKLLWPRLSGSASRAREGSQSKSGPTAKRSVRSRRAGALEPWQASSSGWCPRSVVSFLIHIIAMCSTRSVAEGFSVVIGWSDPTDGWMDDLTDLIGLLASNQVAFVLEIADGEVLRSWAKTLGDSVAAFEGE